MNKTYNKNNKNNFYKMIYPNNKIKKKKKINKKIKTKIYFYKNKIMKNKLF